MSATAHSNPLEQGKISKKWKFVAFWTCFKLQDRTDGGTRSKEAFVALGFRLQLVPQTSNLSQLQSSCDRVIISIGRQNKKALRQTNEVNCAVAGASVEHALWETDSLGFCRICEKKNLYFLKFLPPRLTLSFNPV